MREILLSAVFVAALWSPNGSEGCSSGPSDKRSVQESPSFVIDLANRSFEPDPGVDPALLELLGSAEVRAAHGIVQLNRVPTPEDRTALRSAGVELQQFLGGTAYLAEFDGTADPESIASVARWAGLLVAQDKVSRDLWEGEYEDWAVTDDSRVRVLVSFHAGTSPDAAAATLERYTDVFEPHGPSNAWIVEIEPRDVRGIAADDSVRWLEQGPLPFMPLPATDSGM